MKTERIIDFKFNATLWARTIDMWVEGVGYDIIAELIGADRNTIRNWSENRFKGDFPYPSMTLFLRCCNALDLDPRMFFELAE